MLVTTKKIMDNSIQNLPYLRPQDGFTLVELMITILVAAILATAAFPSFKELITNQRIKSTSFDLMSTLNLARSEAIKRNAQVTIAPANNDWTQGWTVSTNVPTAGTLILNQSAMTGLSITCTPGLACSSITYNGNGRTSGANTQSIQISSNAIATPKLTCISVDLSGLPRSKKASC